MSDGKKSLEEGLQEAAERSGAQGAAGATDTPKIRGFTLTQSDRLVAVGDKVMLHQNTPINGALDMLAEVTKLNANNGTINVRTQGPNGPVDVDSVKNFIPQDRSPYWTWPEEATKEPSRSRKSGDDK